MIPKLFADAVKFVKYFHNFPTIHFGHNCSHLTLQLSLVIEVTFVGSFRARQMVLCRKSLFGCYLKRTLYTDVIPWRRNHPRLSEQRQITRPYFSKEKAYEGSCVSACMWVSQTVAYDHFFQFTSLLFFFFLYNIFVLFEPLS